MTIGPVDGLSSKSQSLAQPPRQTEKVAVNSEAERSVSSVCWSQTSLPSIAQLLGAPMR